MRPTRMRPVWKVQCDRIGPDGLIYTNTIITTDNPWAMPGMVANEHRAAEDAAFARAFKRGEANEHQPTECQCDRCQSQ